MFPQSSTTLGLRRRAAKLDMQKLCVLVGLAVLCGLFSILTENFFTGKNIINIALQTSISAIVAIGETYVIAGGGIDLSVGSVAAFSGMSAAIMLNAGIPVWLAVLLAVAVGALLGLLNGIVIAVMGIAPFIATLGMNSIIRGAVYVITDGVPVTGLPKSFSIIGGGRMGGWFPYAVLIMVAVAIVMAVILKKVTSAVVFLQLEAMSKQHISRASMWCGAKLACTLRAESCLR